MFFEIPILGSFCRENTDISNISQGSINKTTDVKSETIKLYDFLVKVYV